MSLTAQNRPQTRPQNAAPSPAQNQAPIQAPIQATVDDTLDWARFATARRAGEFCQAWLSLQCRQVPGAVAALLLIDDDNGGYAPAAIWPENAPNATDLVPTARQALKDRRGVLQRTTEGEAHAAYPFDVAGKLWGVVAVNVGHQSDATLQEALRRLTWGAGWIETLFYRRKSDEDGQRVSTTRAALEIVAATGTATDLAGAATVLASELAVRLECRRVAIGMVRAGRVRVAALSHATSINRHFRLAVSLANAMEEAFDQSGAVAHPPIAGSEHRVSVAHRDHVHEAKLSAALSVVMVAAGKPVGIITLERDQKLPFDAATITLCEAVAGVAAPVLALQRDLDRPLNGRLVRGLGKASNTLLGRRNPGVKFGVIVAACLCAWLAVATGSFRLSGKATIEGQVQRALAAPFEGFIAAAPHRAGDVVEAGDLIAALDTRDLELEALRDESQRDEARLKAQAAQGKHDMSDAAVEDAHAAEAEAELAVVREKIARAHLRAPFRGLIVSGDLSQKLGSPAEKGKVLFEIAPLDDYRVVVKVDERDLSYVKPGQTARLVLNGLPSRPLDFAVDRVVPVAEADDGKNAFRVEGPLQAVDEQLRPGMEGIAKIENGNARLVWIWSRPILAWTQLQIWKWWP